jgi:hypothetical protein
MLVPAGKAITKVWIPTSIVASSATGYNGFAVYDDTGNLLGETASDPSVFTTLGWQGIDLITPIAADANDRFVYVACQTSANGQCLYTHAPNSIPNFYNGVTAGKRRSWVNNSLSGTWPSTINPVTDGQLFPYIMLLALS